jgi:hypothetical protein
MVHGCTCTWVEHVCVGLGAWLPMASGVQLWGDEGGCRMALCVLTLAVWCGRSCSVWPPDGVWV